MCNATGYWPVKCFVMKNIKLQLFCISVEYKIIHNLKHCWINAFMHNWISMVKLIFRRANAKANKIIFWKIRINWLCVVRCIGLNICGYCQQSENKTIRTTRIKWIHEKSPFPYFTKVKSKCYKLCRLEIGKCSKINIIFRLSRSPLLSRFGHNCIRRSR